MIANKSELEVVDTEVGKHTQLKKNPTTPETTRVITYLAFP